MYLNLIPATECHIASSGRCAGKKLDVDVTIVIIIKNTRIFLFQHEHQSVTYIYYAFYSII